MEERGDIEMLLSAWRDGELHGAEKERVDQALREDPTLRLRLEDLDALSAFVRTSSEAVADEVDFSGFADRVLERVPARKPPLWSRFRVGFVELLEYRRWQVVAATASLAVLLAVGPLVLGGGERAPEGELLLAANGPGLARVIDVEPADDTDAMLFTTASGTTVIYVQER